jgi:hypothetical protein
LSARQVLHFKTKGAKKVKKGGKGKEKEISFFFILGSVKRIHLGEICFYFSLPPFF